MVRRQKNQFTDRPPERDPLEVVLLNPDGTELVRPGQGHGDAVARPDLGAAVAAGIRQLGRTTAAPGPRVGGTADRVGRQGCDEEVVTPVLMPPDSAALTMVAADFFRLPAAGLTVDPASLEVDRGGLRWRARLRTGPLGRRRANLRLYPSPSRNLTVLELIPQSRRPFRTRSFVRWGVPAVGELAARLSRVSGQPPSRPTECSAPR